MIRFAMPLFVSRKHDLLTKINQHNFPNVFKFRNLARIIDTFDCSGINPPFNNASVLASVKRHH